MGVTLVPIFLIVASVIVLLVIVIRKFPQLSLLDVKSLPEVKEAEHKDRVLLRQVQEKLKRKQDAAAERSKKIIQWLKEFQLKFRKFVGYVERQIVHEGQLKGITQSITKQFQKKDTLRALLQDAQQAFDRGNFETAEMNYIAAIRIDAKYADAYRGLGDLYMAQEQFKEAQETYIFFVKLKPKEIYGVLQLAAIAVEEGKTEEAIAWYKQAMFINNRHPGVLIKLATLLKDHGQAQEAMPVVQRAVEIEPQNPKYLDLLVEISILVRDKNLAEEALQQLRMVNPDNQKLELLRQQIADIPS